MKIKHKNPTLMLLAKSSDYTVIFKAVAVLFVLVVKGE